MGAATDIQKPQRKDGILTSFDVAAGQKLFKGRPVILDATDTKYAVTNDGTTITLANGDIFAGIAEETADNTSGAAGDIEVLTGGEGLYLMEFSDSLTIDDLLVDVFVNNAQDDGNVTITSDSGQPQVTIGKVAKILDATHAWVRIEVGAVAAAGA